MRPLSCRRAQALVVASRDGGLRLEARLALDRHLAACDDCRAFDGRDAALEEALACLPEPPVERLDLERQVHAVRAGIAQRERLVLQRRRRLRPVALALALAAGLALVLWLAREAPRNEPADAPRIAHGEPSGAVVAPLAPTPGAPQPPTEPPTEEPIAEQPVVDAERLAAARVRTADALDSALALDGDVEARLAQLEIPFAELAREGWPVARLVERHLDAARPGRAGLAARWLGRADDRLSVAAVAGLIRAADAPAGLRAQALEALLDSLDRGSARRGALLEALEDAGLRRRALAGLADVDDARLAGELRQRLLDAPARDAARDPELCAELARRGAPGLDALVEVAARAAHSDTRRAALGVFARDGAARARLAALLQQRADRATKAARLRVAAELGLPEALAELRAAALERGTRDAALAALALHPDGEAWGVLCDLWGEGRVPEEPLLEVARARLTRGGGPAEAPDTRARLEAALEILLALESPDAAPQLVRLAAQPALALDQRQWALEAVCEVGGASELGALAELLRGCGPAETRVAAACALALYRLGGPTALDEALGRDAPTTARELSALFESRPAHRNRPVTLSRASRLIEPWLDADFPGRPRTEP